MAPWRYWGSRKANSTKVADFDGYFHFEEWIAADIATYRTVSPSVVVMTPNWICDLKYTKPFSNLVSPEGSRMSIEKCSAAFQSTESPGPLAPADAEAACAAGRMIGNGTEGLAERLRAVAAVFPTGQG